MTEQQAAELLAQMDSLRQMVLALQYLGLAALGVGILRAVFAR